MTHRFRLRHPSVDPHGTPGRQLQVQSQVEKAIAPVGIVVDDAGYGHEGTLEKRPLEDMRRQFEVNVFGAVAVMKAFLPFVRSRRRERILDTTSMGGFITMRGIVH